MPETAAAADLDPRARDHVLARLARAESAPWLHQEVARRMAERLPVIREAPQCWLDWWGFLGGGAAAVQQQLPRAERVVVEPTEALRRRSADALRAPWWTWPRRRQAGRSVLLEGEPLPAAQMLWANMVLHLTGSPAQRFARWHDALAVGGFLMFSTLGPDSLRELREVYAELDAPPPHPPFADMHDLGDALAQAGFADPVVDQETLWLTWSSPAALLAELRQLGGHLGRDRHPGLRTPRWRQRLERALAARCDDQGRVRLRFELVYGHAFKTAPRPPRGDTAVVSLDQLRSQLGLRPREGGNA